MDWETISQEEYERRFEQVKQVVRSRIFLTSSFPELLEAYLRFTKSLYGKNSERIATIEREYNVEPERLLTGHSHVMNAKSVMKRLGTFDNELLEILRELVKWAEMMGGWEAPVWNRATKIVKARP